MVSDKKHMRSDLATIAKAVRRGWDVPEEVMAVLPKNILGVMVEARQRGDQRVYLRCVEVLQSMHRDNRDTYAMLDKIERLDSGQATERIDASLTVEQSAAMARNIARYAEYLSQDD